MSKCPQKAFYIKEKTARPCDGRTANNIISGTFQDLIDTKYEGIVESLHFLKIVDGVDNHLFDANKAVTRAEMSKMLVIAHGYDSMKDFLKNTKLSRVI